MREFSPNIGVHVFENYNFLNIFWGKHFIITEKGELIVKLYICNIYQLVSSYCVTAIPKLGGFNQALSVELMTTWCQFGFCSVW